MATFEITWRHHRNLDHKPIPVVRDKITYCRECGEALKPHYRFSAVIE